MFYHKIPFCSISDKVFENTFEVTTGTLSRNSVNPNRETKRILSNSNMLFQYGFIFSFPLHFYFSKISKKLESFRGIFKKFKYSPRALSFQTAGNNVEFRQSSRDK